MTEQLGLRGSPNTKRKSKKFTDADAAAPKVIVANTAGSVIPSIPATSQITPTRTPKAVIAASAVRKTRVAENAEPSPPNTQNSNKT